MIYIHVPFCKSFCVYCAFYSELCSGAEASERQELFVKSLTDECFARRDELEAAARHCPGSVDTLYLGGGTPSVLPPALLQRILSALPPGAGADEFTMEVNPDDILSGGVRYVQELRRLGVSRVSMGVQSFDDGILRWMRRRHSSGGAREAFSILRQGGVDNISIDIISGIAFQTDKMLLDTLQEAVRLHPEHISVYQLSPDEGSELYEMISRGQYLPLDDEACRRQYDMICRELHTAGYRHYEVSNWALAGREAVHNSAYWRRVPYVGLGPGAHSFDGRRRSWNSEAAWGQDSVSWTTDGETLTDDQARTETIMLGLRTAEGLDALWMEIHCNAEGLREALRDGALTLQGGRYRIPEDRFFVSDDIIASLV